MLRKLIKKEIKLNQSIFLILYLILFSIAFMLRLSTGFFQESASVFNYSIVGLFVVAYIGTQLFCIIAAFHSFQNSFFKRPAYLTLTLPVSISKQLFVKLMVSIFWILASNIIALICVAISFASFGSNIAQLLVWMKLYNIDTLILLTWIYTMMGLCLLLLLMYFCISITYSKRIKSYRGLIGVVSYIVLINIFTLLRNVLISPLKPLGQPSVVTERFVAEFIEALNTYLMDNLTIYSIFTMAICILIFLGTRYIFNSRIEID